jgi:hypothetical protein
MVGESQCDCFEACSTRMKHWIFDKSCFSCANIYLQAIALQSWLLLPGGWQSCGLEVGETRAETFFRIRSLRRAAATHSIARLYGAEVRLSVCSLVVSRSGVRFFVVGVHREPPARGRLAGVALGHNANSREWTLRTPPGHADGPRAFHTRWLPFSQSTVR